MTRTPLDQLPELPDTLPEALEVAAQMARDFQDAYHEDERTGKFGNTYLRLGILEAALSNVYKLTRP